ncbi:uncharacterized protein LOC128017649 isoform X10 [Carassius gibelio]|uniref:uncharacterized protein LOC128017649 isoform X10 n=1 Tax=Carassius gibelio TaxID=101364 RepID=UPI0022781D64|nr:uncharacterized protein LOC128017649 isoform X10 [Carassius gibelio]
MMDSPEPSCVSLKSDRSLPDPPDLSDGAVTSDLRMIRQRISSPEPSCVSLKSDRSLPDPPDLSDGAVTSDLRMIRQRISSPEPSCVSLKSDRSLPDPPDLSDGAVTSRSVRKNLFIRVYRDDQIRAQDPPQAVNDELQRVKEQHKTSMKNKYERLFEGLKLQENESLLNSIYTQLYIIEGEREGVNEEHEVLQMEKTARTQHSQDTPIYCNDIFKASAEAGCEEKEQIKTVLTKGIAGIGKTVSVQKFILDWAEGKANQDVDFMFVLPFRELNLIRDHQYSLHRLLLDFHPELQDLDSQIYEECKVVFIFDGLDESRITLMFSDAQKVCDVTETSSVAVLMSKLMKGELLPSALIWITSRPAAANQIPSKYIHRLTEIQGFTEPQKEEYFRKRISDEHQASRIISHIRRARSLHIMCHIPVFCWISSTVLQKLLEEDLSAEIPQTLTEMYIHFLLIQINMRKQKYEERDPEKLLPSNREVIVKLAEVAFKQLMKGNVMFYEEDLIESSIDVTDASVYSGICTEIFKQESVIHQRKVYSFIHLSVQEFLAAFYLLYCCLTKNQKTLHEFRSYRDDSDSDEENKKTLDEFRSYGDDSDSDEENKKTLDEFRSYGDDSDSDEENKKTLDEFRSYGDDSDSDEENKKTLDEFRSYRDDSDSDEENKKTLDEFRSYGDDSDSDEDSESDSDKVSLYDLLTSAVDKSLKSKNGRLDLFLRFLLGVSLESNQRLLQDLLTHTENSSETISRTTQYIKERIKDEDDDDDDLLMVKRGHPLSADQSINLFLCLLEVKDQTLFREIQEFVKSDKHSEKLSAAHCSTISYMLQMSEETLDELNLMKYNTPAEGRRRLIPAVIKCRKALFSGSGLSEQHCEIVSSALQSSNCVLRELDLRNNDLQDSGVKFISDGLKSPNCQLQILSLAGCNLTAQCCERLSSALQSSNCVLRELDLRNNDLQDSGVEFISDGLKSPNCQLQILSLAGCNLTAQCCERLSSALQSSNCVLRELDLRNNDLQDSGVKFISDGRKSPNCQLQILSLAGCNLTAQCCERLSSALQSSNCVLRELDLRNNDLQDSGVKFISDGLKSPNCQLQILSLAGCNLTAQCCKRLSSALQSSNCVLRELDLRNNDLQDSGVKFISDGLKSPNCQLQILRLSGCMVTEEGCGYLSSALSSNPSHLRELDLSYNHPGESGVKLLKHKLQDPNYKLQILNVDHGGEKRMRAELRKYACDLTLDPNTAHTQLVLSDENKKITRVRDLQPYPDHPERFDVYPQVLSVESLTGRCYWETEWSGDYTEISVSYKGINRKGEESDCVFGYNDKSWSLDCSDNSFSVCHNNNVTDISAVSSSCKRVGVYVDVSAGSLSFYSVSDTHTLTHLHTHTLTHLHTHNTTFTEPLYAGFRVNYYSSVSLCDIKEPPVRIISDAQAARSSVLRYQPLLKCQSCVHISDPDPDQWDQIEPSLCTDEGVSKFRVSTGPGRYECLRTRMRWVCDGDVTLQYHTVDGRFLNTELERLQCNRIAPVMDVTVISGKLEEVHLPHYICLGESGDALRDAVNVLSVKDEGITTEAVELTRFHAKIVQPSFSLKTLIISWILRWDEHCDLLLYRRSKDPLILHVYFFPADYRAKEKVEKNEESGYRILHPRPDRAFRMKTPHSLDVPGASVNPKEGITLRRQTDPNFFKIVIKTRLEINLQMSLTREEDKKEVWTTTLEKEEFDQNHPQRDETQRDETRLKSEADKARYFDDHWSVLIQRVTDVQIIADKLRQHQLIHEEQYSEIIQSLTSQDGMRKICAIIRKHNDTVKAKLISILQEEKLFHF